MNSIAHPTAFFTDGKTIGNDMDPPYVQILGPDDEGNLIRHIARVEFGGTDRERGDLARLLAAAPELRAHLEFIVGGLEMGTNIPADGAAVTVARQLLDSLTGY